MKTLLPLLSLLLLPFSGYGQEISNVDLDAIEERARDESSDYFYPALKERVLTFDTSLSGKAYKHLYYGSALVDSSTSTMSGGSDTMDKVIEQGEHQKAIAIGKQKLQGDPAKLGTWYKLMVAYYKGEKKDSAKLVGRIYYSFLQVIYRSGQGRSADSAFVVKSVDDEYQVLRDQKLQMVSQTLLRTDKGPVDQMTVTPASKSKGKQKTKQELKLYFNVTLPFEDHQKMFGGSEKGKKKGDEQNE